MTYLITALGEVFQCGEALDLNVFQLVSSRVHLGDNNVLTILEFLTELLPDGSKLLAVSAPWSI